MRYFSGLDLDILVTQSPECLQLKGITNWFPFELSTLLPHVIIEYTPQVSYNVYVGIVRKDKYTHIYTNYQLLAVVLLSD